MSATKRQVFRAVLSPVATVEIPVILSDGGWVAESFGYGEHDTAREAALGYAAGTGILLTELRGPGEATTAEQIARVMAERDAAQRSAAQSAAAAVDAARDLGHVVAAQTERAEAAERECARLRHEAGQVHDLVVERDHYRERARTHGRRINELQSIGAAAMRQGLDACHRLRVRVAWHERLWRQELAHPRYGRMVNLARHYRDRMADAEALVADAMAAGLAESARLRGDVAAITDAIGCDEGTPVATVVEMAGAWIDAVKILMEKLDRRDRALAGDATGSEGACLLVEAVLRSAVDAPNFAQWHGDYADRTYLLTVQWAAGKTPAELISAANADRDAAVARREALAGAVRAYLAADAEVPRGYDADYASGDERVRMEVAANALDEARAALDALLTEEVGDGR